MTKSGVNRSGNLHMSADTCLARSSHRLHVSFASASTLDPIAWPCVSSMWRPSTADSEVRIAPSNLWPPLGGWAILRMALERPSATGIHGAAACKAQCRATCHEVLLFVWMLAAFAAPVSIPLHDWSGLLSGGSQQPFPRSFDDALSARACLAFEVATTRTRSKAAA